MLCGVVRMSEETVMLSARVPKELKDLVNADKRDNQEVVQAALRREFGGERLGALDRRIEEKKSRISLLEREENERRRERKQEEEELEALQAKRERVQEQQESELEEAMQVLESVPWKEDNNAIQQWAEDLEMDEADLINQLEDYHAQ